MVFVFIIERFLAQTVYFMKQLKHVNFSFNYMIKVDNGEHSFEWKVYMLKSNDVIMWRW